MPETFGYERGKNPTWTLWGPGFDKLSLAYRPIPEVGDDQVLARREVCTICFSSVKEILSGNEHPRLVHIDFQKHPVVLGDEGFLVLEKVGKNLKNRFEEGRGYSMVPDYGDGISAFGYDQDGALTRWGILEGRPLDYLIPVDLDAVNRVGMYAISLSEPVGCHEMSCTLTYRTAIKPLGTLLIIGDGEETSLCSSAPFNPAKVVAIHAGKGIRGFLDGAASKHDFAVTYSDSINARALAEEHAPRGWDDILIVSRDSKLLNLASREFFPTLAREGVMAFVGGVEKGTIVELELGTYHYDQTLLVGTMSNDLASAYTENTRFGIQRGSTVVYFGAGGPMGQTGMLWAAALGDDAPSRIVGVDALDDRLQALEILGQYMPKGTQFELHNGIREQLSDFLAPGSVDYLMILAPVPKAIESYMPYMADGSILNFFAGLRNKYAKLDAYDICARRIRLIGHSGDDIPSQKRCLDKILSGKIVTDPVVAAVGGMDAAWDALWATHMGSYPGKICIYPGARHPLVPVSRITGGKPWSADFERKFLNENPW